MTLLCLIRSGIGIHGRNCITTHRICPTGFICKAVFSSSPAPPPPYPLPPLKPLQLPSSAVNGLLYIPSFLSNEEQQRCVDIINAHPFSTAIARRQQFYGEAYYHTFSDVPSIQPHNVEPCLPLEHFQFVIDKFYAPELSHLNIFGDYNDGPVDRIHDGVAHTRLRNKYESTSARGNHPTQVLVNEYRGRQSIGMHRDNPQAFGDVVAGVSLLAPIEMAFTLQCCLDEEWLAHHSGGGDERGGGSGGRERHCLVKDCADNINCNHSSVFSKHSIDQLDGAVYHQCVCFRYNQAQGRINCDNDARMHYTSKICKVVLEPGSVYILRDDARYLWRHGIGRQMSFSLPLPLSSSSSSATAAAASGDSSSSFAVDSSSAPVSMFTRDSQYNRLSLTIRKLLDTRKRVRPSNVAVRTCT